MNNKQQEEIDWETLAWEHIRMARQRNLGAFKEADEAVLKWMQENENT